MVQRQKFNHLAERIVAPLLRLCYTRIHISETFNEETSNPNTVSINTSAWKNQVTSRDMEVWSPRSTLYHARTLHLPAASSLDLRKHHLIAIAHLDWCLPTLDIIMPRLVSSCPSPSCMIPYYHKECVAPFLLWHTLNSTARKGRVNGDDVHSLTKVNIFSAYSFAAEAD